MTGNRDRLLSSHRLGTVGQNSTLGHYSRRCWTAGTARSKKEVPVEIFLANDLFSHHSFLRSKLTSNTPCGKEQHPLRQMEIGLLKPLLLFFLEPRFLIRVLYMLTNNC